MSPAFAHFPAEPFPETSRSHPESCQEDPRRYTEQSKSWQSLVKDSKFRSCFSSGLPTPPESRAMTGVSCNQHSSNDIVSQNYYPSKYSYPTYPSSKGTEAKPYQQNADPYTQSNSSMADQPRLWSGSRKREDSQGNKDIANSDSTIASYLQIPASINDSKGSLAEFAAEVGSILPSVNLANLS
jgi:hypothetical protein